MRRSDQVGSATPRFRRRSARELAHLPLILETPWIGKDEKTERPMYEAEIAMLPAM